METAPFTENNTEQRQEAPWQTVAASPKAMQADWPTPHPLSETEIRQLLADWTAAAERGDLIAIGREALSDPRLPARAAMAL
jgi:2,4-dienoyl-CoA reductase-like NADH-dependent reductase (Old Yellow Enzyme family)